MSNKDIKELSQRFLNIPINYEINNSGDLKYLYNQIDYIINNYK